MKKARSTRELLNFYPSWSEIRNNYQSVGAQYLNTIGKQMDSMDKYLMKMSKNAYLGTLNLDEIDWIHKVELPVTYSFSQDTTDKIQPVYTAPSVSGLVLDNITDSGYIPISLAEENSLENFWYEAVPTRFDLQETLTSVEDSLLHLPATSFPYSGMLNHHISDGGVVWVEMTSGTQYISIDDEGRVERATITLEGHTRKGTKERETLVFPWDMKQQTSKEWKSIERVEIDNVEDEVSIEIRSANCDWGPYISFYNLRWSDIDTKIDEFWDIGEIDTGSTIDLEGYIDDEWQNLMLGFSGKTVKDRWELIDADLTSIDAVDLAVQPFTDRAWVVGQNSKLYCFDLEETMASGINFLVQRSSGSHVKIELEDDYYTLGDEITFAPLHVRPVQDINKYRVWYETPAAVKYGFDSDGSQVSYTSDFWQYPADLTRQLGEQLSITASERGEYKIAIEAVYSDDTVHVDRIIVPVKYKQPLSILDISSYIAGTILGIDFDRDQRLWVKTTSGYYRFSLHADLMLIDYDEKIIFFREEYTSVEIG